MKHHIAEYNGKQVVMDYVPKEREFKMACLRILDNGFDGVVICLDGKRYAVNRGSKTAKLIIETRELEKSLI